MLSQAGRLGTTVAVGLPLMANAADPLPGQPPPPPKPRLKVVVTGGHPGDPEYGCGGTIARYADLGHEIVLRYLNDGDPPSKPGPKGLRVVEARKACEILKARPLFAGQVDGAAVVDPARYDAFRKILAPERPDVVFTHWPIDNHADHRAIAMLTYDSWLRLGRTFALDYYEVSNGEDTVQFSPTHHVDGTSEAARVFRAREPEPREVLRRTRAGHAISRDRERIPPRRRIHPPHSEPRLRAAGRCVSGPRGFG